MKNIVVLISGRGSNMRAIVEACTTQGWGARVVAVISNRADAAGLEFARSRGIAAEVIEHQRFASRDAFDAALAGAIDRHSPDLVVLAGFMRILGGDFVRSYAGRLVNIHPSLLPAFPGLHTHRRAIESGCTVAGATVHLVTPEVDHGPIVVQAAVPVMPADDEASLAGRVLEREHVIYPMAVRWLVDGQIEVRGQRTVHAAGLPQFVF